MLILSIKVVHWLSGFGQALMVPEVPSSHCKESYNLCNNSLVVDGYLESQLLVEFPVASCDLYCCNLGSVCRRLCWVAFLQARQQELGVI